jgi:protease I
MPSAKSLEGKHIAILAEDLYEDLELWYPLLRLREAGAEPIVVGPGPARSHASKHGYPVEVEKLVGEVDADDFDAVIIPGGYAPDRLRRHPAMVALVRRAVQTNKVVAAICHAGWLLASAEVLQGRTVTGFFAIKDEVVVDGNLITSRQPSDLPAFCRAVITALGG